MTERRKAERRTAALQMFCLTCSIWLGLPVALFAAKVVPWWFPAFFITLGSSFILWIWKGKD